MKKGVVVSLMLFILMMTVVSAITFNEPTTFSQDNIKYVFHDGVELDTFDFSPYAITINGNHRISTIPIGGTLEINFYEWSETDNLIGVKSNVKQNVNFRITVDGNNNYLFDGEDYFLESVPINIYETNFTYVFFNENNEVSTNLVIEKDSWFKRNILIIIIPEINSFFDEKVIRVTNFTIILLFLGLSILIYIVRKLLRGVSR